MNQRIKELYQQAHSIRYHDGDPMRDGNPPTVYWQGEVSAERFAQLIVRECASYMYENYPHSRYEVNYMRKHMGDTNWNKPIGVEE